MPSESKEAMQKKDSLYGLQIRHDNDTWKIVGEGVSHEGKVYLHLASLTRGRQQKNGLVPLQMADWIPHETVEAAQKVVHKCVPWRGAGGSIGDCVYCGKNLEAGEA